MDVTTLTVTELKMSPEQATGKHHTDLENRDMRERETGLLRKRLRIILMREETETPFRYRDRMRN